MPEHLMPLRQVEVALAREALIEASQILKSLPKYRRAKSKGDRIRKWLERLPKVLDGLPQTYNIGDLVRYSEKDGTVTDGVVVCTVTCHENYVVTAGDDREAPRTPETKMWMLGVERLTPRSKV